MRRFLLILAFVALAGRTIDLQRKLRIAVSRGDMYRDISQRLDRQIVELRQQAA